ncbi:hypothetical protein FA95DRAFT_1597781 [Auriscalpium vulgare]|uniref:Uncharacterized protein n=1 Tax=Auriscalpium vulgare TaxID=40419 RepID=A0ACB8RHY0_9AGAM|nr:hypothetical protein FA95DRAFT_1597781 [Auriscalpium vulgare]
MSNPLSPFPSHTGGFRRPTHTVVPAAEATTTAPVADSDGGGGGISHNSLGIIFTFIAAFFLLLAFGVGSRIVRRRNRAAREALTQPTRRPRPPAKPNMFEVWLDDDGRDSARGSGAAEAWQPISAWTDGARPRRRRRPPQPAQPTEHHAMMSQAWFRGVYGMDEPDDPPAPPQPFDVHVAVLIAMPSQSRSSRKIPLQSTRSVDTAGTSSTALRDGGDVGEYGKARSEGGMDEAAEAPALGHDGESEDRREQQQIRAPSPKGNHP